MNAHITRKTHTIRTRASLAARLALCAATLLSSAGFASAQQGEMKVQSSWSISRNEDGKSYQVQSENGKVSAKIDGQNVPEDRIKVENGTVTLLDEKGQPIFQQEMMFSGDDDDMPGHIQMFKMDRNGRVHGRAGTRLREQAKAELPKVMVGVQLVEPDPIIRGHFGLKEGDATMISAVHQGLAAASAGIEPYDIVVAVNGQSPASPKVVRQALREKNPGDQLTFEVIHKGAKKTVTVTTEKYDAEKLEAAKVDAIASAGGWGGWSGDGDEVEGNLNGIWGQPGMKPFVFNIPGGRGQGQVFVAPDGAAAAADAEQMAKRAMERAEQIRKQFGNGNDMNRLMEERMKRMEQMLEQMMKDRPAAPAEPKKDEKQS
jgi:hypothetical protein